MSNKFVFMGSILCGIIVSIAMLFLFMPNCVDCPPAYTLKQNGDTLFLKKQLIHDTLVVIKTIERQPRPKYVDSGTVTGVYFSGITSVSSGWIQLPERHSLFKNGKTKDTIYEHEIEYY